MRWYKADLHLHSVLSPCGDLEMSPQAVMRTAKEKGIEIIAITDHNSAKNIPAYKAEADSLGLNFIYGIEVQTAEEIHIIALFETYEKIRAFDRELYHSLLPVANDPDYFGDQVIMENADEIAGFEEKALINSSVWSYEEMYAKVTEYGGAFIPAHVDAHAFSVIGQLGFVPDDPPVFACGITAKCDANALIARYPYLSKYALVRASDAHYLKDIASGWIELYLEKPEFGEIIQALKTENGRLIKT